MEKEEKKEKEAKKEAKKKAKKKAGDEDEGDWEAAADTWEELDEDEDVSAVYPFTDFEIQHWS